MNDDLLFWGADHGGPTEWRTIARQHALTVARWNLRPTAAPPRGALRRPDRPACLARNGARSVHDLTWARVVWAVAGFTAAYGETRDPALLAARRAAGWTLAHLPAEACPGGLRRRHATRHGAGAILASAPSTSPG